LESVTPALLTGGNALLLSWDSIIAFYPDTSFVNGTATMTFRAWDETNGNAPGDIVTISATGGSTAFSVDEEMATMNIFGPGTIGNPDNTHTTITTEQAITIDLGNAGAINTSVSDPIGTGYDMVYYEQRIDFTPPPVNGGIELDQVKIEVGTRLNPGDAIQWYQVFFWGDTTCDINTPIAAYCVGGETDNKLINTVDLFGPAVGAPPYNTGILININKAPGTAPAGTYQYIRITDPSTPDGIGFDSVRVCTVANPCP